MRILVAPNAFKGCLSASEAARRMALGVKKAFPRAGTDLMPLSDGGDGLMDVLTARLRGRKISLRVKGPLGKPRRASYAMIEWGGAAVVEMAQASGISGLAPRQRDPLNATSFGTGELIRDALRRGARTVIVGMGGSATNDGGAGMARALGARFYDAAGRELPLGAAPLVRLERVDVRGVVPEVKAARVLAVSDVDNPLLGPRGSARVYGPQKGATPAMVRVLEKALSRYARVLRRDLRADVARVPGSGAAGGLGAGLIAFLRAKIVPGADWVLDRLGADGRIKRADMVLTGEGRFDMQSFYGKAPVVLAKRAFKAGVRVGMVCGSAEAGAFPRIERLGGVMAIDCATLSRSGEPPGRSFKEAGPRLTRAAEALVRAGFMAAALALSARPVLALGPKPEFSDPSFVARVDQLYLHRDIGDNLGESIDLMNAEIKAKPRNPGILWRLGRSLARMGERQKSKREKLDFYERARAALQKSVDVDPSNPEAHFWLGIAMGRIGQTRGVLKSLFLVGPIKREMRKALELDPRHAGAHHVLGEMYHELPGFAGGSNKKAAKELKLAVSLEPNHLSHYVALAGVYIDMKRFGDARETLNAISKVAAPDDPGELQEDLADAKNLFARINKS